MSVNSAKPPFNADAPAQARLPQAHAFINEVQAARPLRAEGAELVQVENPATGEPLGRYQASSAAEVDAAVAAARGAFAQGPSRRERAARLRALGALIREHHAVLATLESLQNGKLLSEAYRDDVPEAADVCDYYAGWTDKLYGETCPVEGDFLNYTEREPLGVCGLIVPWNFPLLLALWKIAPALAMGNTVVVKPAPYTPYSLLYLAARAREAGVLPEGALEVIVGGADPGERLCRHPGVDKVSFTGSTAVGRKVLRGAADSNLKELSLELGGKSANIIFEDAPDLQAAIDRSFVAMFSHKGEKCSEPTRLLVHRDHYAAVLEALAARAEAVLCGDPFAPESEQGPQCHREHFERVLRYIDVGRDEGARLVAGGGRDRRGDNGRGYFVRPTIFADVHSGMRIAQEEIFGPVLAVMPFGSEAEAVRIANDSTYGLAAGLWTRDVSRAHRVARALQAGMVWVNRYGCYDFASPFGGFRQSGWGKEMAQHSLHAYTRLKSIWIKL